MRNNYTSSTVFILGQCILGVFERIETVNIVKVQGIYYTMIVYDYGTFFMKNTYTGSVGQIFVGLTVTFLLDN